jgi:hypothetical protein
MEHWWNDTVRRKMKYCEENLLQCHSVHNKSHMDWPEIERVPAWGTAGRLHRERLASLSHATAQEILLQLDLIEIQ